MYSSVMSPMTKRLSWPKLQKVWGELGPVDYGRPTPEQRLMLAIFDKGPSYPDHKDFATYEEYALAIRQWERRQVEFDLRPL